MLGAYIGMYNAVEQALAQYPDAEFFDTSDFNFGAQTESEIGTLVPCTEECPSYITRNNLVSLVS